MRNNLQIYKFIYCMLFFCLISIILIFYKYVSHQVPLEKIKRFSEKSLLKKCLIDKENKFLKVEE